MPLLGGDPGVFIRSMASRGRVGGIARATDDAMVLLDSAGFDVVLVETVGAGQGEVDIARTAQTTVVVEVPGMGDDVQSIKAGMLEIADLFVVNKADREGADQVVRALRTMLDIGERRAAWKPPVLTAVATKGEGSAPIVDALDRHRQYLASGGDLAQQARGRAERELRAAIGELAVELLHGGAPERWKTAIEAIATRQSDPYSTAQDLINLLQRPKEQW
jgi:LAO/AO transport system kinase